MRKEVGGVHTTPLSSISLLLYLVQIKPFVFLLNSILVAVSGAQQFSFMGKNINQSITQRDIEGAEAILEPILQTYHLSYSMVS